MSYRIYGKAGAKGLIFCDGIADYASIVKMDYTVTEDTEANAEKTYYTISDAGAVAEADFATGVYEKNATARFAAGTKIFYGGVSKENADVINRTQKPPEYVLSALGVWGAYVQAPYDLIFYADCCGVGVTSFNRFELAGGEVTKGDVLTITATADDDLVISALTVNGEDFTSGSQHTVAGNVTIIATATESEE